MKSQFTISSAYQWKKDENGANNSEKAIKRIVENAKNRFTGDGKINYNINYRRLRASAGKPMLDSIIRRITDSQIVIIDITTSNQNVFIEAGIAIILEKNNPFLSVYFIREKNPQKELPNGIPSDLQGYFISEYVCKNEEITFKDNNSLRMSIESDIKEYFNSKETSFNFIDEINESFEN
jgi:hypothetical protein